MQQAVNQVRADVGLDAVAGGSDSAQVQSDMATLLGQLQDLEKQVPDLPDDVKALLADAKGDIHSALQGEEADNIQGSLLNATDGLIEQINQYKVAIAQIELEEWVDGLLLQRAEQDLQGATLRLLQEIQTAQALGAERELLSPLNLEVLQKVAYAEQAVEISQDLAKQSKDLLNEIIERRKEERKARKKAFWNETLGTIAIVFDLIGTVLSFIPPLKPVGMAFKIAAGVIRGIIAAINGDWSGALYQVAMATLQAMTMPGNPAGLSPSQLQTLQQLQALTQAAYGAYQAANSGDNALAFLHVVQGLASAVVEGYGPQGLANPQVTFAEKLILTLGQTSVAAYQGIQAIDNGEWGQAFSSIASVAGTVGNNFAGELRQFAKNTLGDFAEGLFDGEDSTLKKAVKTAFVVAEAGEEGGIDGWLGGMDSVLNIWRPEIQGAVNEFLYDPDILEVAGKFGVPPEEIEKQRVGNSLHYIYVSSDGSYRQLLDIKETASQTKSQPSEENADDSEDKTGATTQENNEDSSKNQSQSGETNPTDSVTPSSEGQISQEAIEKAEEIDNISSHVQQLEAFNNLPEEQKAEVRSYFKQEYSDRETWIEAHPILVADGSGSWPIEEMLAQKELSEIYFPDSQNYKPGEVRLKNLTLPLYVDIELGRVVLPNGQWISYHREKRSTIPGSTFWKASKYNTEHKNHQAYTTIEQRHAYYELADAYLQQGDNAIKSKWFGAAVIVTDWNAIGGAEMQDFGWVTGEETDDFLKAGNKYLFEYNMSNFNYLMTGEGIPGMESLKGIELDYALVEFEQKKVTKFIDSYKFTDKKQIIKEVNDSFSNIFASAKVTSVIKDKFENKKRTFDFFNESHRIELGKGIIDNLYKQNQ